METALHHGRVATAPRGLTPKNLCEKKQCYLYINKGLYAEGFDDVYGDLHSRDSLWDGVINSFITHSVTSDFSHINKKNYLKRNRDVCGRWDFDTCFNNGCLFHESKVDISNKRYRARRSK
jgi:hypothetical protein